MKLYAFQPKGHGQQSFFVIAENEEQARKYVSDYIAKNYEYPNGYPKYQANGWGSDYYELKIADIGEVIENDND